MIFTSRPTRNVVGMLSPYIIVPNLKLRRSEINFFLMLLLSILMRKFRNSEIDVLILLLTLRPYPHSSSALEAGKHVLSQKPFVLDLDDGQELVDLADRNGLKLAVNQNGRGHLIFHIFEMPLRKANRKGC